jgi:hypothetical protein
LTAVAAGDEGLRVAIGWGRRDAGAVCRIGAWKFVRTLTGQAAENLQELWRIRAV